MAIVAAPEHYRVEQTPFVPNSRFPIIVYRSVLPQPVGEQSATEFLEANGWIKKGTWGAIKTAHFHPNTHECYGIVSGESTLLLGRGPLDDAAQHKGLLVCVSAGDVIVIPAGVSHCSVELNPHYRYVGVYPEGAPKWKNQYCKGERSMDELKEEVSRVDMPNCDPVYGLQGPLCDLWSKAAISS